MVDQKAIAERLNISVATVSRSLQNDPNISPHTRARVNSFASQSGYRPRRYKQLKKQEGLRQLGFLAVGQPSTDNITENYINFTRMLRGMVEAAQQSNAMAQVDYICSENIDRIDDSRFQPVALREGLLQGVVLAGCFPKRAVAALAQNIPVIRIIHHDADVPVDSVDIDCMRAGGQLIEHLVSLGHRKIGFVCSSHARTFDHSRFAGYVEALSARGLNYDPANVINLHDILPDAEGAAERLLVRRNEGVRAWVAASDATAYDLAMALQRRGMAIPRDISLCGYDNFPARAGLPKLTSIDLPFEELGSAAVQRLLQRIERPTSEAVRILYGCRLVVGASTAAIE